MSHASNRAGSAPNKIARKFIASFRIAANRGNAAVNRSSVSCCRRGSVPRNPCRREYPRRADLGLRDQFLPVIGDIEQFRALKLRKTQLTAAASHKAPEFSQLMAIRHCARPASNSSGGPRGTQRATIWPAGRNQADYKIVAGCEAVRTNVAQIIARALDKLAKRR